MNLKILQIKMEIYFWTLSKKTPQTFLLAHSLPQPDEQRGALSLEPRRLNRENLDKLNKGDSWLSVLDIFERQNICVD